MKYLRARERICTDKRNHHNRDRHRHHRFFPSCLFIFKSEQFQFPRKLQKKFARAAVAVFQFRFRCCWEKFNFMNGCVAVNVFGETSKEDEQVIN